jgi:hypothetical protein
MQALPRNVLIHGVATFLSAGLCFFGAIAIIDVTPGRVIDVKPLLLRSFLFSSPLMACYTFFCLKTFPFKNWSSWIQHNQAGMLSRYKARVLPPVILILVLGLVAIGALGHSIVVYTNIKFDSAMPTNVTASVSNAYKDNSFKSDKYYIHFNLQHSPYDLKSLWIKQSEFEQITVQGFHVLTVSFKPGSLGFPWYSYQISK